MPAPSPRSAPAAFSSLPSPSPLEHRWSNEPDERPSDGFLVSWYNAGHAGGEAPTLKVCLEKEGWSVGEDGSGHIVASTAGKNIRLIPAAGGYQVLGAHGPKWMPDSAILRPFDFLAHCSHGGARQDALEAVFHLYLSKLRDSALALATGYSNTDAGNMERLVDRWRGDMRYSDKMGWHIWDGTVWRRQDGKDSILLMARMRETIRFARWGVSDTEDETGKFLLRSENTSRLRAALDQARSHGAAMADDSEFILRPWTVGFPNGVWANGRFGPCGREHRITRLMQSEYLQEKEIPGDAEWRALLDRMVCGDSEKERMLQEVAGAAIGGGAQNRILPWLHGQKGTGKSTFIALLQTSMGEAALPLGTDMVNGHQDAEKLGVAALGRRLLILSEMGNERVSTSLIKRLTGGDALQARFLYSNATFHVSPTWMVIASSNDAPKADARDAAFWDGRMKVIALDNPLDRGVDDHVSLTSSTGFPATLEEARADPASPLVQGFVRWAMEGAKRLHGSGKGIAWTQAVRDATEDMRRETDPVSVFHQYLMDGLTPEGDSRGDSIDRELKAGRPVNWSEIHRLYKHWCDSEGVRHSLTSTGLLKHMMEHYGFKEANRDSRGKRVRIPPEDVAFSMGRTGTQPAATQREGVQSTGPMHWQLDQPPGYQLGVPGQSVLRSEDMADGTEF